MKCVFNINGRELVLSGIADRIEKRNGITHIIDYKTGKSAQYADTKQLKLLAACVFTHFPEIAVIKAAR